MALNGAFLRHIKKEIEEKALDGGSKRSISPTGRKWMLGDPHILGSFEVAAFCPGK